MLVPPILNVFVEQASCLLLTLVQDVNFGVAEYRYEVKISQLLEARLRVSFVSSEKSLFIP